MECGLLAFVFVTTFVKTLDAFALTTRVLFFSNVV